MSTSIVSPFPIFNEIDGTPLDGGYIYIGTANLNPETSPVNVYWDAALTIPAAQPIRTIGGYPSRMGTPSSVYVSATSFSITVRNINKVFVYNSANTGNPIFEGYPITRSQISLPLLGTDSSFVQAGDDAVTRTLQDKAREFFSVKDFGAIGDGVANDTDAIQAALDQNSGGSVFLPAGTYLISDTLYIPPATALYGEGSGDNWQSSSSEKGSRLKITGTGTARIWTDVGTTSTPSGTLVDAPISVAVAITGSGCTIKDLCLEGGIQANGSDAWHVGFFNPSVKRTVFINVETVGKFSISGCYIDATWSTENTALQTLHTGTYGRTIPSDVGSNEISMIDCWWRAGNWGCYVKGTQRDPLPSPNIWSPGGVSDLSANSCRFSNDPIGTSPNFPENSGAYYRDLQSNYQNRYFEGCSFRSTSAYSVYLDRGRWENFLGLYGETTATNCVTQAVSFTVDSLGKVNVAPQNGTEWSGASALDSIFYRVYLTNSSRIDSLTSNLRPGAVVTTSTGSFTIKYIGYNSSNSRAFLGTDAITGTITAGQTITQVAGQAVSTVFYATDRDGGVYSTGQNSFISASNQVSYYGVSTQVRNLRSVGIVSTASYAEITASDNVSINCNDATSVNFYINKQGAGTATAARLRFAGTALLPYNSQDLGSNALKWKDIYATNGTIITSDERQKQQIQPIEDAVLRVWEKVEFLKFKMNDAVAEKGSAARWHFGVIAQRIKEAFESEGLSAFDYGILCYGEWEDEYEDVKDENGNVVKTKKITSAGNAYSVRYDEALILECALMRSKLNSLLSK
jgi:hypothetical protein